MELSEKIEAAMVSYLSGQTWPADFTAASQILPGESDTDLTDQVVFCAVQPGRDENPQYTGNFLVPVRVYLITPVAVQTDETSSQLAKHSAVAAVLENAILVDDLAGQLNTASAALGNAFTCFEVMDRTPMREQAADRFTSGFDLTLYACPADVA
jgi:hypothetical protein